MKQQLKKRWAVPMGALVLTLSIGSAAFAASGSSSAATSSSVTSTSAATSATSVPSSAPAGATSANPWGTQRSDETLLTGTALDKVKAIALAEVGSDATIVRIETDSDASLPGHGAYEAHVVKADGTALTVYADKSFNFVGTETMPSGAPAGGHLPRSAGDAGMSATSSSSASATTN